MGKFCQKCFFYFSQLLLTSSFLTNVILVKLKILCILMQWSKWFIFWNVFILQIISFLELFSAICFLCILQTHLTRRNTSIPKKLKKRKLTTFMMASSNDGKSDIYQFFIQTYPILLIQYMYKISCKMDRNFLRYSMFFHHGPASPPTPPPILWFSNKPSPGRVNTDSAYIYFCEQACIYWST